jgi:hypothetical protein
VRKVAGAIPKRRAATATLTLILANFSSITGWDTAISVFGT